MEEEEASIKAKYRANYLNNASIPVNRFSYGRRAMQLMHSSQVKRYLTTVCFFITNICLLGVREIVRKHKRYQDVYQHNRLNHSRSISATFLRKPFRQLERDRTAQLWSHCFGHRIHTSVAPAPYPPTHPHHLCPGKNKNKLIHPNPLRLLATPTYQHRRFQFVLLQKHNRQ